MVCPVGFFSPAKTSYVYLEKYSLSWSRGEVQGQTRHGVPRSSWRCKSHKGTAHVKEGGKRSCAHVGCISTVSRGTSMQVLPVNSGLFSSCSGCSGFWNVYGVMFEEVGTRCRWVLALPLRTVCRPRVSGRGELRGPWQGLGPLESKWHHRYFWTTLLRFWRQLELRAARLNYQFRGIELQVCSSSWVGTLSPNDTHVIVWSRVGAGSTSLF